MVETASFRSTGRAVGVLLALGLLCIALAAPAGAPATAAPSEPSPHPCDLEWRDVSPSAPVHDGSLNDIEAVSANDVWAVGTHLPTSGPAQTLIARWDGAQWTRIPSPNAGTADNALSGVSVISPDDIWAVGYYVSPQSGLRQTLTLHWDGVLWSIVSSPNPGQHNHWLTAVDGAAPDDVWAIGHFWWEATSSIRALTMHWDGTSWSAFPMDAIRSDRYLEDVEAISTDDVWVVGYSEPPRTSIMAPLIYHWDGVAWTLLQSPRAGDGGGSGSQLHGIAALGPNDIWAVGHYSTRVGEAYREQPLFIHWDGTAWAHVTSPNIPLMDSDNVLYDISASSPNDIWAVGRVRQYDGSAWIYRTLAAHWDGAGWSIVPSPGTGPAQYDLQGVAAVSPTEAWAAGGISALDGAGTVLLERYSDRCAPTPNLGCSFSISSFEPCFANSGCAEYSVPLKNEGDTGMVVAGTLRLLARSGEVIGEAALLATYVAPGSTTYVGGAICPSRPAPGPYLIEVSAQAVGNGCPPRQKTQPVRGSCP